MLGIDKFNAVNYVSNINKKTHKTTPGLQSLKQDTVSFKMAYKTSSDAVFPIIKGNKYILQMGTTFPVDTSLRMDNLTDKNIFLNPFSILNIGEFGGFQLPNEINIQSLNMSNNSEIKISIPYKKVLQVNAKSTIADDCKINFSKIYFNTPQVTIGNNFNANHLVNNNGSITLGDSAILDIVSSTKKIQIGNQAKVSNICAKGEIVIGTDLHSAYDIISTNGDISIGNNYGYIGNLTTTKTLSIGSTSENNYIKSLQAQDIKLKGKVVAKNVKIQNSITSPSLDRGLTVEGDLDIPNLNDRSKKRTVIIENTEVKGDLIIRRDSRVKEIILRDCEIQGKLVLEDPKISVTKEGSTTIANILKPDF